MIDIEGVLDKASFESIRLLLLCCGVSDTIRILINSMAGTRAVQTNIKVVMAEVMVSLGFLSPLL